MKLKVLAAMLVATTAVALTPIDDLNKAVEALLKPINNNLTKAELVFTALEVNETSALKAGLNADYRKQGELTDLALVISELSYDRNITGKGPRVLFDASVDANLLAIVDQEMINEIGPEIVGVITDMAQNFLQEYGTAAEVLVRTEEDNYDKDGNLVSLRVYGSVKVDLKRLPEAMPLSEVPVTQAEITLAAGVRGLSAEGTVIMNPAYKAFNDDELGLKEAIEMLLAQEPDTMRDIQDIAVSIDEFIGTAVNEGFKSEGKK